MKHNLSTEQQNDLLKKLPILRFFEYAHLPEHLQALSAPVCDLAWRMANITSDWERGESQTNPETAAGLRKLLEAKDCFVRAKV